MTAAFPLSHVESWFHLDPLLAEQLRETVGCARVSRAWTVSGVEGLALVEVQPTIGPAFYRIVHAESGGYVVSQCACLPVARVALHVVAPLADWRRPFLELAADATIRARWDVARALMRQADDHAAAGIARAERMAWVAYDRLHAGAVR